MENIFEFLRSDICLIVLLIILFLLLVMYITNTVRLSKLRKNYKSFMKKLGNGKDIEEMLEKYMDTVENVEKENKNIMNYCNQINKEMDKCIQKVGMVRYNAFKDTGSDLSFTLALLNVDNNGVVLNGIYSREMSNIYAKPVKNGKSPNTLSEEEIEAINRAINQNL